MSETLNPVAEETVPDIRCVRCGRPIRSTSEHSELCPRNFFRGQQLSHSVSFQDNMSLVAVRRPPKEF
jgi:Zinc finger found in FPG and IleRS